MLDDREFLMWLADRLVLIYKEDENTDFVHQLVAIAVATPPKHHTQWSVPYSKMREAKEDKKRGGFLSRLFNRNVWLRQSGLSRDAKERRLF